MKRNKQIGCVSVLFFLTFVALVSSTLPAAAVSTDWQADPSTPASWHDPLNWSNGLPVPLSENYAYITNGGTAQIVADYSAYLVLCGYSNVGHIEQSGGSGTISNALYLGHQSGSTGTYDLIDGQLSTIRLYVGSGYPTFVIGGGGAATGIFTQSGGTNAVSSVLALGYHPGSTGTYNLNNGHLSASNQYIGYVSNLTPGGTGYFSQTGGTNEAGYLYVKEGSSYTLSGGTLSISGSAEIRGSFLFDDGNGSLDVTGGLADFSRVDFTGAGSTSFSSSPGTLTVFKAGFDPAASFGYYNPVGHVYTPGTALVINAGEGFSGRGLLEVADSFENMGTIGESGGTLELWFYADFAVRGSGRIYSVNELHLDKGAAGTLADDGLIWAGSMDIGETSGTSSTFTQTGGSNQASRGISIGVSGSTGTYSQSGGLNICLGLSVASSTSAGIYNLSGGQLSAENEYIGNGGTGTFIQDGGINAISSALAVGVNPSAVGLYILNDGELSTDTEHLGWGAPVGDGGAGTFTQRGGTNTVSNTLNIGRHKKSTGTYNLLGGQLYAANQYIGGGNTGTGAFIQEGGVNSSQYLQVGPTGLSTIASSYVLHAGQLNAKDIYVTPYGYFENSGGPGIREILVTHSFLNESTYNEQFRLLNTTLILLGDGPGKPTTLDTNSLDMGLGLGGYYNNFALGNLIFEGSTITSYYYKLFSDVYTLGLVIEDGVMVDLNGYNIYYIPMGGTIHQPPYYEPLSPSTFYLGGTWMNGEILPAVTIPEPGTVTLLALGALGVLASLRRRADRA